MEYNELALAVEKLDSFEREKKIKENQEEFNRFLNKGEPPNDYENQLIKNHKGRIISILNGDIIPPYEIEIQPSSNCNLKCEHCFGKALTCNKLENKIGKKEMNIIAERICDFRTNGFQTETVKFCGTTGEPLMNPSVLYGIDLFKSLGKKVILFTNGLFLDKKYENGTKREYLDYLLNMDELILSLDCGSEETFIDLKGSIGFNRIKNSLEQLINKRDQTNSKLSINIGYVIGEKNYHEIVETTKLMRNIGVDFMGFRVDFTKADKIHKISEKIKDELKKAKEYKTDKFKINSIYSDREIECDNSAFDSYGRKCFNQHFWACIGPNAELYSCGHRTYYGVESYGSLLKKTFEEIWNDKKRRENLKNLPDDYCKYCSPSSVRRNDFMTFLDKIMN
jgi:MoaA/NifB/PqqE/SkfB family radical SAM enzyme